MSRSETRLGLTNAVVASVEIPREVAATVVETILDEISKSLRHHDPVFVRGFGTFGIRRRKSCIGHNPRTGAKVQVSAKLIAHFKPCAQLKHALVQLP